MINYCIHVHCINFVLPISAELVEINIFIVLAYIFELLLMHLVTSASQQLTFLHMSMSDGEVKFSYLMYPYLTLSQSNCLHLVGKFHALFLWLYHQVQYLFLLENLTLIVASMRAINRIHITQNIKRNLQLRERNKQNHPVEIHAT